MDSYSIPKDYKNAYKLKHCLTVAYFVGIPCDIAVLQKEKDMDALIVAASKFRWSVSKTLLEWGVFPKRGDRSKGTLITGLAKKIITYRNRIKNDQSLPEKTKVDMVKLIGFDELAQLGGNIPGQGIS